MLSTRENKCQPKRESINVKRANILQRSASFPPLEYSVRFVYSRFTVSIGGLIVREGNPRRFTSLKSLQRTDLDAWRRRELHCSALPPPTKSCSNIAVHFVSRIDIGPQLRRRVYEWAASRAPLLPYFWHMREEDQGGKRGKKGESGNRKQKCYVKLHVTGKGDVGDMPPHVSYVGILIYCVYSVRRFLMGFPDAEKGVRYRSSPRGIFSSVEISAAVFFGTQPSRMDAIGVI